MQNVCLATHAVWMPENLVPHSLIAIGHPDPEHDRPAREMPAPEADRVVWLGEKDK